MSPNKIINKRKVWITVGWWLMSMMIRSVREICYSMILSILSSVLSFIPCIMFPNTFARISMNLFKNKLLFLLLYLYMHKQIWRSVNLKQTSPVPLSFSLCFLSKQLGGSLKLDNFLIQLLRNCRFSITLGIISKLGVCRLARKSD